MLSAHTLKELVQSLRIFAVVHGLLSNLENKMQYIKLEYLLKRKGSATRLAERSGVPQSHLTRWKQAGAIVEASSGVVYLPSSTAHRLQVDEVMELAMELEVVE
jgi:hypothetical protein